MSSNYVD